MHEVVVDVRRHRGRFFQVLQQTARSQTAVMTVPPGQDGGPEETHAADQIVYVIEGEALLRVGETEYRVRPGHCALIPAGTLHHVHSSGAAPLFFLTVYAPPEY
jgi:mannose-6-phosphate isomerase-like protein (cupin superfamily)